MKDALLFTAVVLLVLAIVLYVKNMIANGVTPNPATFFIRSTVAIINCFSYFTVVHQDNFKTSITVISAVGLSGIFFYALARGKFTKLRWVDVTCAGAAMIIVVIWKSTGNAVVANLILQGVMLLSFYPAVNGVLYGHAKEKSSTWILATLCYVAMVMAILVDWKTGSAYQLVHPIVSGIIGNGALAVAVLWHNGKKRLNILSVYGWNSYLN